MKRRYNFVIEKVTTEKIIYYDLYRKYSFWQKMVYISDKEYIISSSLYSDETTMINHLKRCAMNWMQSQIKPKDKVTRTTIATFTLETTDGKTTNEVR